MIRWEEKRITGAIAHPSVIPFSFHCFGGVCRCVDSDDIAEEVIFYALLQFSLRQHRQL